MRADSIMLGIEKKYTPPEFAEIAQKMASAIAEVETISGEKKVSDAAFNERIKKADNLVTTLARQYNKGCEVAQIACDIRYDVPEVGKKSYVRMDTGETVKVHDMEWEEKQESIQFPLATTEQVNDVLKSIKDDTPVLRCPKCKAAQVNQVSGWWVCLKCEFRTQDEDDMIFDLPTIDPPPPPTDDKPGASPA